MNSDGATREFEKMIVKAKHQVEIWYDCVGSNRKWLETSLKSYSDDEYEIVLYVLEGSPAKGYVVADWGIRRIRAQSIFGHSRVYRQGVWSQRMKNHASTATSGDKPVITSKKTE